MQVKRLHPRKYLRSGKVLLLVVITLPALFAVVALTLNTGMMNDHQLDLQHAADAAAVAVALEMMEGTGAAMTVGRATLRENLVGDAATIAIHSPPQSGVYAGSSRHVEVVVQEEYPLVFKNFLRSTAPVLKARSVAAIREVTAPVAVHILDQSPEPLAIGGITGILPALPALLGGLEVEGLGAVKVHGAVVSNTNWSGLDEQGLLVGLLPALPGLQHSITCTPLLPLTGLQAEDVYVAGGVDTLINYRFLSNQSGHPVKGNRKPVIDPLRDLPVPTTGVDSVNVRSNLKGAFNLLSLPLLLPPVVLEPGVYDYINIISGRVQFRPGVYVVRGVNPLTGIAVQILTGNVEANGVMFYITNSSHYSVSTGSPDSADGETAPPASGVGNLLPSVVINAALLNSNYVGLNSPGSPFHGMLIYQRRADRRPIVILKEDLLLSDSRIEGMIYAKWGHVILAGKGTFHTSIAAGTARFLNVAEMTIRPQHRFTAVQEVSLVE